MCGASTSVPAGAALWKLNDIKKQTDSRARICSWHLMHWVSAFSVCLPLPPHNVEVNVCTILRHFRYGCVRAMAPPAMACYCFWQSASVGNFCFMNFPRNDFSSFNCTPCRSIFHFGWVLLFDIVCRIVCVCEFKCRMNVSSSKSQSGQANECKWKSKRSPVKTKLKEIIL